MMREEFHLYHKLSGDGEPTPGRGQQLKETADLVHALLRAKLTRQFMVQMERSRRSAS